MTDLSGLTPQTSFASDVIPVLRAGAFAALAISAFTSDAQSRADAAQSAAISAAATDATTKANAAQSAAISAAATDATTKANAAQSAATSAAATDAQTRADAALASALAARIGANVPYNPGSGRYIATGPHGGTLTTVGGGANRMEIAPWICPINITTDRLGLLVSTGVASANAKVIIYAADANGRPTTLLYESGDIDCSSITFASVAKAVTLTAGTLYYIGVRHSSTATLNAFQPYMVPSLDWGTTPTASALKVFRRTLTYATAAPNPWGFDANEATAASPNAIFLRVA